MEIKPVALRLHSQACTPAPRLARIHRIFDRTLYFRMHAINKYSSLELLLTTTLTYSSKGYVHFLNIFTSNIFVIYS